jgi:hypothetical protein
METKVQITKYQFRLLLGSIISLMGADGIISVFLMRHNLAIEANPLMRTLAFEEVFPLLKIIGALISVLILSHAVRIKPGIISFSACLLVLSYTFIVYWNLFVFFLATSYL